MEILLHLLIILVAARTMGRIAIHLGLPPSLGEIMAGAGMAFILSQTPDIPWLATMASDPALKITSEIGMFFLLLYAGIEMTPAEIARYSRQSLWVAAGGVILPLGLGFALAWHVLPPSPMHELQALLVGVALSISAIAVAAKVLAEMNLLHLPIGDVIISAAVFDDVFGFILLAILTSLAIPGTHLNPLDIIVLVSKVIGFFALTGAIGIYVYPVLWRWAAKVHVTGLRLTLLIVLALIYSWIAEISGLHFLLGPFMAGLFFEPLRVGETAYEHIDKVVSTVTSGFFGPMFFATIGLAINFDAVFAIPGFLSALIAIAMIGKIVGAGVPAYLSKDFNGRESLAIGVGMSGRGAVELVVITVAERAGLFAIGNGEHLVLNHLYSALIFTAIITTALTPVLLRAVLRRG